MGIESDQLVFDYLSRVGDLAQQRHLPSSARMRLVSALRGEIDRRRDTYGQESPTVVRAILDELGTPDEVVDRASGAAPVRTAPAVPKPRTEEAWPTPPHLVGTDEVGAADTEPDWWSTETPPRPGDDLVPGFRGGVEIPELLKPPVEETDEEGAERAEGARGEGVEEPAEEVAPRRGWKRLPRLRRRTAAAPAPEPEADTGDAPSAVRRFRLASPFLWLAALLLIGGAVFGNLVALAVGWLLAYASRRLSRAEIQWAVVVLPALAATAGAVWIWGRVARRWGAPIAEGGAAMGAAISETWPWALKGAAVASALFLIWRARRH
ncbi:hypothetical protein J7E93_12775 [Streptomyces sp. ISL-36]|uniref:hypothetical protein n=1 Tax=Streptomyces sp. ISL-36 TaxID=2819182 RepID=UPI001BE6BEE9|nr:hypothetical protein [Streptomyces sp. ISL-36]MBT2440972.1 hypothetical protein [Streptomyces sp. ISL-36]